MAEIKELSTKIGKDREQLAGEYPAGRNMKWYNHSGNLVQWFL